jgi:cyclic pyranopterin phosphate synthase
MPPSNGRRPVALRLSVTDRCNMRCAYCVPDRKTAKVPRRELPRLERLAEAVGWLQREFNVATVKVTGGEPLLRRGVVDLIGLLVRCPGIDEVSMTTNGTYLAQPARALKGAGLARLNVSLDSVHAERFRWLTRGGRLEDTLEGIRAAREAGFDLLKLNAVLLRSTWREDVPELLDFAASQPAEMRFIELMGTGTEAAWVADEYVSADVVRDWLEARAPVESVPVAATSTARRTRVAWRGREVMVGWITPRSHPFCDGCHRLRLDARGRLFRCLMDPLPYPLVTLLAEQPSDQVRRGMEGFLAGKRPPKSMDTLIPMIAIGG